MKQIFKYILLLSVVVSPLAFAQQEDEPPARPQLAEDEASSTSYAIGKGGMGQLLLHMDGYFETQEGEDPPPFELDREAFERGVMDALEQGADEASVLEFFRWAEASRQRYVAREQRQEAEQLEDIGNRAAANRASGEEWLAENGAREGVETLASGLQIEMLSLGDESAKPTIDSRVKVHYVGYTIDGNVFDSSRERGSPAEFPLGGVIEGWQEGLQLIGEGGEAKLYIPANLAYGDRDDGRIPPGSTLIFEVELLEILDQ